MIVSVVSKVKYEKKFKSINCVSEPSLNDFVTSSNHNLVKFANGWKCLNCAGYSSSASAQAKNWLSSLCLPLPFDDRTKPVPIPAWHVVQIGNIIPHSTHTLWSHKGIVFCDLCGGFGVSRSKFLVGVCSKVCTVASEKARVNIRCSKLPAPNAFLATSSAVLLPTCTCPHHCVCGSSSALRCTCMLQ